MKTVGFLGTLVVVLTAVMFFPRPKAREQHTSSIEEHFGKPHPGYEFPVGAVADFHLAGMPQSTVDGSTVTIVIDDGGDLRNQRLSWTIDGEDARMLFNAFYGGGVTEQDVMWRYWDLGRYALACRYCGQDVYRLATPLAGPVPMHTANVPPVGWSSDQEAY